MGEGYPGYNAQQLSSAEGTTNYLPGDQSVAAPEEFAAGSGKTKEKHGEGSFGRTADVLGGITRAFFSR